MTDGARYVYPRVGEWVTSVIYMNTQYINPHVGFEIYTYGITKSDISQGGANELIEHS